MNARRGRSGLQGVFDRIGVWNRSPRNPAEHHELSSRDLGRLDGELVGDHVLDAERPREGARDHARGLGDQHQHASAGLREGNLLGVGQPVRG